MNFQILKSGLLKNITIIFLILCLFIFKLFLNNFLMAENGDTYDFFRISYELQLGNFLYESKRLPLYSILLSPFNSDYFVFYGRIVNNLIYFLAIFFFYKLISLKFDLKLYEKLSFTTVFALNFIVFDNSFYILSDTLLLFLVVLFFYFYEKKYSWFLLSIVGVLSVYTRFEGLLLLVGFIIFNLFKKEYLRVFKFSLVSVLFFLPLVFKFYLSFTTGNSYFSDEAGFTLKFQNIIKAIGSVIFATGGFWLLSIIILNKNLNNFKKGIQELILKSYTNLYFISFLLFSFLLILWGFFIRLYSPIVFFSIIYFIYLYKNNKTYTKSYFLTLIPFIFYILNVQILDHFDLGYFKLSKIISIVFSFLTLLVILIPKFSLKTKLLATTLMIIIINLAIFTEKFIFSREKYYTLVQASEFVNQNNFKNVAYFDESGVQGWYLKDFNNKYQYYINTMDINDWLNINKIEYIMITEEMGYQIAQIVELRSEIKNLEEVKSFKSNYFGGKTVIYKLDENKIYQKN